MCVCVFFQVVIIFLQKMDILLAKTPKDDVRDHVLPMVCKALEATDVQLQVQLQLGFFLVSLPYKKLIVYQNIKNRYVSPSWGIELFLSHLMSEMMWLCMRFHA